MDMHGRDVTNTIEWIPDEDIFPDGAWWFCSREDALLFPIGKSRSDLELTLKRLRQQGWQVAGVTYFRYHLVDPAHNLKRRSALAVALADSLACLAALADGDIEDMDVARVAVERNRAVLDGLPVES